MVIRKANLKDLTEIDRMFRAEFGKPPYNERWKSKDSKKKLKNYLKEYLFFVLIENKKVVGFVIAHSEIWDKGKTGFIDELVVDKKYQKKGYGSQLIRYIENLFKKKGIKKLELMTSPKSKAYKLYKKIGFKDEEAVLMEKKLK